MMPSSWSQRVLTSLAINVGPCAWDIAKLDRHLCAYVQTHPSLLYLGPDDEPNQLRTQTAPLTHLPVLLCVREPEFTRRLPDLIRRRLDALGRPSADIVTLWLGDESVTLKGGRSLQTLFELREQGLFRHVGLAHADVRDVEWLTLHTPTRVLVLPYSLANQAARYRVFSAAADAGTTCLALTDDSSPQALRFSLAETSRALPICTPPLPEPLAPLSPQEIERRWQAYRLTHPEPAPLSRSQPPGE